MLDELACTEVGQRAVEGQHQRRVHARIGEEAQLLVDPDQARGAQLGPQQRQRVAVERDGDDARAGGLGIHPCPVDDRAVPRVDAVELADRDDGRAEARGHVAGIPEDDHDATAAGARRRRLRDGTMRRQPPEAEERQHERHEQVARAEPGPHRRMREQLGHHEAQRADDQHARELEHDRHPRHEVPAAAAGEHERERGHDVHERRKRRERVGERRLVEALDDLHEGPTGGAEGHDRVDDHEHAADAGHAGAGGRRHNQTSLVLAGGASPCPTARQATWTVQITCMRHTITAMESAAMPMITVLQRLRSSSAHATAATGSSTADTR